MRRTKRWFTGKISLTNSLCQTAYWGLCRTRSFQGNIPEWTTRSGGPTVDGTRFPYRPLWTSLPPIAVWPFRQKWCIVPTCGLRLRWRSPERRMESCSREWSSPSGHYFLAPPHMVLSKKLSPEISLWHFGSTPALPTYDLAWLRR